MALREGAIALRFAGGIDSKTDRLAVPTTKLLTLENAVFTKAASLSKRYGYTALTTLALPQPTDPALGLASLGPATAYEDPRGIAARGDELVLVTDDTSYSYVDGAGAWDEIGGVASVFQSDRVLVKTNSAQTIGDYAAVSGVGIAAWEDSRGGVYWSCVEDNEGRVLFGPEQASSTGSRPRCVRCGAKLILLWAEASLGQIKCIVVDPSAPNAYDKVAFPRIIVSDLVTTVPNFDAVFTNDENSGGLAAAAITWNATGGVRVGWLDPSGVIGSPVTGWPSPATRVPATAVVAGPVLCALPTISSMWYLAWSEAGNSYVTSASSSPSLPGTPVAANPPTALGVSGIDALALAVSSTGASDQYVQIWLENRVSPVRNSTVTQATFNTASLAVTTTTYRGVSLASSGWTDPPYDGGTSVAHAYATLVHDVPLFRVLMTIREDGLVVARSLPGNAGTAPARAHLPSVFDDGDGGRLYRWCAVYRSKLDSVNSDVFTEDGLRLVSFDFAADDSHQTAYAGRTLYLGAACPQMYDGAGWVEHGPHYAPDWETTETLHTNSTAGTGGMTAGTRSYVFWYEATLANGEIMRGPVSKPYAVTTAAGEDRVTVTVPTLRLTAFGVGDRENCRVCAARTVAGDAAAYYRITSLDPSTAGGINGYVANTRTADSVSVIDELSDTNLLLREPIYTTAGVLSNDPIPGAGVIAEGKGRLFFGDPSNENVVYHSQERADGYTIECAPELRIVFPPAGGAVTAIAVMDELVVGFKRGAIYAVTGEGPVANPDAGGGWSLPALLSSAVGCIDQRSLVLTPLGLMFQSAKGIYLLDRGRSLTYIGAPVESHNSRRITRATSVDDTHQVRFLTNDGLALLYDYQFNHWGVFTQHGGLDSVVVAGTYHYLRADGRVFKQATTYADDNLQIPLVIETAFIRFRDYIQGFQRVWHAQVMGTWQSAHKLLVQVQTDEDAPGSWSEPATFDATSAGGGSYGDGNYGDGNYGGDSPTPYQFTAHVGRKCQAIRFRFTFFETAGTFGACAELVELLLTGGAKLSRYKLPDGRTK